jgi:bifunctional ADP-heptose synthase (sugar kinase/adenylyltransferase)
VVATLALALAAGASLAEGAVLANLAAGIVVGKLGTATASPEELVQAIGAGLPA